MKRNPTLPPLKHSAQINPIVDQKHTLDNLPDAHNKKFGSIVDADSALLLPELNGKRFDGKAALPLPGDVDEIVYVKHRGTRKSRVANVQEPLAPEFASHKALSSQQSVASLGLATLENLDVQINESKQAQTPDDSSYGDLGDEASDIAALDATEVPIILKKPAANKHSFLPFLADDAPLATPAQPRPKPSEELTFAEKVAEDRFYMTLKMRGYGYKDFARMKNNDSEFCEPTTAQSLVLKKKLLDLRSKNLISPRAFGLLQSMSMNQEEVIKEFRKIDFKRENIDLEEQSEPNFFTPVRFCRLNEIFQNIAGSQPISKNLSEIDRLIFDMRLMEVSQVMIKIPGTIYTLDLEPLNPTLTVSTSENLRPTTYKISNVPIVESFMRGYENSRKIWEIQENIDQNVTCLGLLERGLTAANKFVYPDFAEHLISPVIIKKRTPIAVVEQNTSVNHTSSPAPTHSAKSVVENVQSITAATASASSSRSSSADFIESPPILHMSLPSLPSPSTSSAEISSSILISPPNTEPKQSLWSKICCSFSNNKVGPSGGKG